MEKSDGKWILIEENVWKPKLGDKIEGTLIDLKRGVGKYNQNIYVIEDSSGKKTEVWGKTQLDNLMMEIEIDEYIRITFNGTKTTGNGYLMNVYSLEKKK